MIPHPGCYCVFSKCKCACVYLVIHTCPQYKCVFTEQITAVRCRYHQALLLSAISWQNEVFFFFFSPSSSIIHRCFSRFSRDRCLEPKETRASTLLAASELCLQPRWLSWSFTSLLLWPRRLPLCWRQTGRHRATSGVPGQAATDTGQVWTSSPSPQYAVI